MSTPLRLLLPAQLVTQMFQQARMELPNECCGLLAGCLSDPTGELAQVGKVLQRYSLTNAAASPDRYENASAELFAAFRHMRQNGLEHLAIYHSHPTTEPVPSKTDREQNFYGPDIIHLIISLKGGISVMRGWRLGADSATEAEWRQD